MGGPYPGRQGLLSLRAWGAGGLGKSGGPEALDILMSLLLEDPEYEVRIRAALALGKIGDPSAARALIVCLKDSYADMRGAAVEALGKIGDPSALDEVKTLLDDEDKRVREAAAEALEKIQRRRGGEGAEDMEASRR